jgi:hypothetical protein
MEAKASKHASKCEHACARARVRVRVRARARAPRARSLMATLPRRGPAEDGSELRSHACGVAKVEARGHAPGVGRIVTVTVTPRARRREAPLSFTPVTAGVGGQFSDARLFRLFAPSTCLLYIAYLLCIAFSSQGGDLSVVVFQIGSRSYDRLAGASQKSIASSVVVCGLPWIQSLWRLAVC